MSTFVQLPACRDSVLAEYLLHWSYRMWLLIHGVWSCLQCLFQHYKCTLLLPKRCACICSVIDILHANPDKFSCWQGAICYLSLKTDYLFVQSFGFDCFYY